jgi:hypothetical protein
MMKYKDGKDAERHDVISWNVDDTDDNTIWRMTGIYKGGVIIYLGGGIDFGVAMGDVISVNQVLEEAENNDEHNRGISRICTVSEMAAHIGNMTGSGRK